MARVKGLVKKRTLKNKDNGFRGGLSRKFQEKLLNGYLIWSDATSRRRVLAFSMSTFFSSVLAVEIAARGSLRILSLMFLIFLSVFPGFFAVYDGIRSKKINLWILLALAAWPSFLYLFLRH